MIVKEYIKRFEKLEFGLFVHFGLYSVIGRGEWVLENCKYDMQEYERVLKTFNPDKDWAIELAKTAKMAGCRYITLTTRHHDGFSLYDNSPLNTYDAPHALAGRDLVREFVDACREYDLVPFFYHTLLDWREKNYNENFKEYLKYLRSSIEILCTRYGKIGGLWFDGMWNKPDADWEEDALYSLIRKYQPEAMIINNTGIGREGELGHIELDSVTFERGRPQPINQSGAPKYIASEMCQIFGDHWGYAALDFNFKSLAEIITDYCNCRRFGSNLLINVGPMANGKLRPLDTAMLFALGEWIEKFKEGVRGTLPTSIAVSGKNGDFILKGEDAYYLFCNKLPVAGSINVVINSEELSDVIISFDMEEKIKSINWLDTGAPLEYQQKDGRVEIVKTKQPYGQNVVVRIAKIKV